MEESWWLPVLNVVWLDAHRGAAADAAIAKKRVILADSVVPGVLRVLLLSAEAAFGAQ